MSNRPVDVVVLTDHRWAPLPLPTPDRPAAVGERPTLLSEDAAVVRALEAQGLTVRRLDWADPGFDWRRTRCALFRTTWDYFERYDEFRVWLELAADRTRLFNAADVIRWNVDKRYLLDLAAQGVRVPPTVLVEAGDPRPLGAIVPDGWGEVVVKPVVSGAARRTFRVPDAGAFQATWAQIVEEEAMLVQPLLPAVLEEGEVSVIVVDGEVTHAVRKVPKRGDFRVQDDHGGRVVAHQASPEEVEWALRTVHAAQAVLAGRDADILYARVDGVRGEHGLELMELELVEPELFFRFAPAAADRLAGGVVRRLERWGPQVGAWTASGADRGGRGQ